MLADPGHVAGGKEGEAADRHGEEVLERRHDAWARLLATFRAVHGGVTHEAMRSPAYGGGLFDPDRHPFLEGRAPATASSFSTGSDHGCTGLRDPG
jgi:hypothetical protein